MRTTELISGCCAYSTGWPAAWMLTKKLNVSLTAMTPSSAVNRQQKLNPWSRAMMAVAINITSNSLAAVPYPLHLVLDDVQAYTPACQA
jgi:hypothetical protein